jgi:5-methylthioribose kinase
VTEALRDDTLPEYLRSLGLAGEHDRIAVEPAGDGNINWVRRARIEGGGRSWVVKQARPALERFPQYRASSERIVFEARYYEVARRLDEDAVCPRVVHFDEPRRTLILEDLGGAERLDHALARGADGSAALVRLARFLAAVHAATRVADLAARFANDEMRRLHGDHVFHLPFHDNDFALAAPVRERALRLQADAPLVRVAARAYARYLEPRGALVHGDVQAGNVLLAAGGAKLLDAEIAHVGDPAFDVGALLAHVFLPAVACGRTAETAGVAAAVWSAYTARHGAEDCPAFADVSRYAGIEMMRRTVGAARVPVVEEPQAALAVIDVATSLMREPPTDPGGVAPILAGRER